MARSPGVGNYRYEENYFDRVDNCMVRVGPYSTGNYA